MTAGPVTWRDRDAGQKLSIVLMLGVVCAFFGAIAIVGAWRFLSRSGLDQLTGLAALAIGLVNLIILIRWGANRRAR